MSVICKWIGFGMTEVAKCIPDLSSLKMKITEKGLEILKNYKHIFVQTTLSLDAISLIQFMIYHDISCAFLPTRVFLSVLLGINFVAYSRIIRPLFKEKQLYEKLDEQIISQKEKIDSLNVLIKKLTEEKEKLQGITEELSEQQKRIHQRIEGLCELVKAFEKCQGSIEKSITQDTSITHDMNVLNQRESALVSQLSQIVDVMYGEEE